MATERPFTQPELEELKPKRGRSQIKVKIQPRLYFQTGRQPLTGSFFYEAVRHGRTIRRVIGQMPQVTRNRAIDIANGYDDELELGRLVPARFAVMTVLQAYDALSEDRENILVDTKKNYRSAIARTGLGSRIVHTVTETEIRAAIRRSNKKYRSTRANFMRLSRVFKSIARRERIADPTAFMSDRYDGEVFKAHPPRQPRYSSLEQFGQAIGIARAYPKMKTAGGLPARPSRQIIADHFEFCALTGLRAWAEAARVRVEDIDFDALTIRIPREHLKQRKRKGDLMIPITEPLVPLLERRIDAAMEFDDSRSTVIFQARSLRSGGSPHIVQASSDMLLNMIRSRLNANIIMHSSRAEYARVMRTNHPDVGVAPDHVRLAVQDWKQPHEAESTYAAPDIEEIRPWAILAAKIITQAIVFQD